MQLEIKFKSIAVRWFFNMFLIVVLIVCAVVIGFIAVVNSLYTEKIAMYAADITYEFNSLSETTPATFRDTAIDMAENFGFKDKEAWFAWLRNWSRRQAEPLKVSFKREMK